MYWSSNGYETMHLEVDIARGLFCFNIVGLADRAMTESKMRILAALKNCNFDIPQRKNEKVIVSLLPGNRKKAGIYSDLAIAFGYLRASRQINDFNGIKQICCIGEIQLDGTIYIKEDIVHLLHAAHQQGLKRFIIPKQSSEYLHLIPGIEIMEISTLHDLRNIPMFTLSQYLPNTKSGGTGIHDEDFWREQTALFEIDKLKGLQSQKRALAIGLAGNHHILFSGPPGSGKSALAQCAGELLDPLTDKEAIESYSTYQLAPHISATRPKSDFFIRPVRRPHHLISAHGLIGNGVHSPGELFLGHNGAVILDELCEFDRESIESLREPLDRRHLFIRKRDISTRNELITTIIATTNTCPCGKKGMNTVKDISSSKIFKSEGEYCTCTMYQIKKYQNKISEPLLDRFPIVCNFLYEDQSSSSLQKDQNNLHGKYLKQIIWNARQIQRKRNPGGYYNQYMQVDAILKFGIADEAKNVLTELEAVFSLSKRKIEHIIKIARTIADMENNQTIESIHLMEAVGYVKTKPFN